jgi:aspartate/methionine/tyrosine aminotransferase
MYTPNGAFYIMVDIGDQGIDSREFALALLKEKRVAVAPGTAFGMVGQHTVRVSLATEKSLLIEGVTRLCEFIHHGKPVSAQTRHLHGDREPRLAFSSPIKESVRGGD